MDVLRSYDKTYTYIAPPEAEGVADYDLIGRLVTVPFGNESRLRKAIILEVSSRSEGAASYRLKTALQVHMDIPALNSRSLAAAMFMRDRFYCSTGEALRCFMPAFITEKPKAKTQRVAVFISSTSDKDSLIAELRLRSMAAIKALDALMEYGQCPITELKLTTGVTTAQLNRLRDRGVIAIEERPLQLPPPACGPRTPAAPLRLNPAQLAAAQAIEAAVKSGCPSRFLLHGVTGSGKTEVYMQAIRGCIEQGKGALVIVPEIALTPQFQRRFEAVFGARVTVLHSAMTETQRRLRWQQVAAGGISIVVGPRSALFAPVRNLGLIVVDEQHDGSYRSEQTPKYDAVLMAEKMSEIYSIPVVEGSATPSVDSYQRALDGDMILLKLDARANNRPMPKVTIVDLRRDRGYPVSNTLLKEIGANIASGGKTMILLNRRGFATTVSCGDCGRVLKCPSCGVRLHWHRNAARLVCHYCGFTTTMPDSCYSCGSHNLIQRGAAIQFVEESIKEAYPNAAVFRLDSDQITYKNTQEQILDSFRQSQAGVLIGTQMISKGHDFPDVTLVGILGIDSILQSEGYLGPEKAFQAMMQTAGRAGRGTLPGRVFIETTEPDNFCIRAVKNSDYEYFFNQEMTLRRRLNYPPFGQIASCCFVGDQDRATYDACLEFKEQVLQSRYPDLFIAGPARPVVPKQGGKYRWKLILRRDGADTAPLYKDLIAAAESPEAGDSSGGIRMSLDFNPDSVIN